MNRCFKCNGLMVWEEFTDLAESFFRCEGFRCVNCGGVLFGEMENPRMEVLDRWLQQYDLQVMKQGSTTRKQRELLEVGIG